MIKVMSKSACVIFSKMIFSWMLSSLVKLSCIWLNMMSMSMSMTEFASDDVVHEADAHVMTVAHDVT